jgi:CheY-like chemotaxis protein
MDVLIADDDRICNRILQEHFQKLGFSTGIAFDATQAWTRIINDPPRLVVLDIQMPGGTGYEVLKRIRRIPKTSQIPVIVVTGSQDPSRFELIKAQGANAVLPKPPELERLDVEISRILGNAGKIQPTG